MVKSQNSKNTLSLTDKYATVKIEILASDIFAVVKNAAREEFDDRRKCTNDRVDDYIKTVCTLQKYAKSLESKINRLESQISMLKK